VACVHVPFLRLPPASCHQAHCRYAFTRKQALLLVDYYSHGYDAGCVVYNDPIIKVFQLLLLLCCGKQQVEFLNLFLLFYIDCLVMNTVSTADIVRVCVCVCAGEGRRLREDVCCHEVEMTSENSSDDLPIVSAQYTRWMD
jgi:hypothetical protein